MFSKSLDDGQVLPHNIVHKMKKFTFRLTDEEKVTLDVEDHNIMDYNYLDENFSLSFFLFSLITILTQSDNLIVHNFSCFDCVGQEDDMIPYFRSQLSINGDEIMNIESEMVEWAEHTLLY